MDSLDWQHAEIIDRPAELVTCTSAVLAVVVLIFGSSATGAGADDVVSDAAESIESCW